MANRNPWLKYLFIVILGVKIARVTRAFRRYFYMTVVCKYNTTYSNHVLLKNMKRNKWEKSPMCDDITDFVVVIRINNAIYKRLREWQNESSEKNIFPKLSFFRQWYNLCTIIALDFPSLLVFYWQIISLASYDLSVALVMFCVFEKKHSFNCCPTFSGATLCGKNTFNLTAKNDDTDCCSNKRDWYSESSGAASSSPSGTPSGTDHPGHVVGSTDQDQEAEACSSASTTQRGKYMTL